MSNIKRFEQDYGCMVPEFDGGWVEFADHEAELTALREQLAAAEKRAEAAEAVASAVTNALTIGDKDFATLGLWSDIDKNGDGKQKYVARVTHPYHGRADSDACESIAEAIQSASKAMATRQIRKQKGTDDATD